MENIKLYEHIHISGFSETSRIWITETDYFRILKSEKSTWFWTEYRSYDFDDNLLLRMYGDHRIPSELIQNSMNLILNRNKQAPVEKPKDESLVYFGSSGKVMTQDEYSKEYRKMRQLSGLKRGTHNPNL